MKKFALLGALGLCMVSAPAFAQVGSYGGNAVLDVKKVTADEFVGPLTGDITGDITGDVTGDLTGDVTGDVTGDLTGQVFGTTPAEQEIAAGGTVAANACGGIKRISTDDQGAVTTSTTNTFTAPAAANAGCIMQVCNSGSTDNITLDDNALSQMRALAGSGSADTVLTPGDCVPVGSDGSVWRQLAPGSVE